jgi:elongation factor G
LLVSIARGDYAKSDLSGKLSAVGKAPSWLIEFKIGPRWAADAERLLDALAQMAAEDCAFGYSKAFGGGELVARVFDELHVDATVDILKRRHNIEVSVGAPQVAYRETLTRTAEVDHTHKKQTGRTGQFARVKLRLEPKEPGTGNEFASEIVGGVVPKEYIPSVEKGVQSVWNSGVLIGFPMVDMKVTLFDGAYHEVDSSTIAFESAARQAMRDGCEKAGVKLLEPIMDVEVVTPGEFVGSIIGDLNSRRGRIRSQEMRGNAAVIRADVPLARTLGYERGLRSIANGLGSFVMCFSHYAEVPWDGGPDDFRPAVGMRVGRDSR